MERRTKRFPWARTAVVAALTVLAVGCAKTEQKLGRGISNTFEVVRLGEMRRSVEQTALFEGPNKAYTTGVVKGFNKTIARTGVGIYEILTCPFPPYDPVFTNYLSPNPVQPDSFSPGIMESSTLCPDTNLGFSGGEIAPMVPGSRFRVFEN
jgi:putative exosortase-associated protein (TIGR04073 family)